MDAHTCKAFAEMKALIAADAFCAYPDHNKPFEIYTDSSDYQLGAAILQSGKPVAYYLRKLSSAQLNYSTMEKELLAIVTTLNAFHSMLLGAKITVYTDYKNLKFKTLNNRRVLNWRLTLEDFNASYIYVEGKKNVLADAFLHLPRIEGKSSAPNLELPKQDDRFYSLMEDSELFDCFVNFPPDSTIQNPLGL